MLACEEEVEGWGCDDDLWLRVNLLYFANVMDFAPSWVAEDAFQRTCVGVELGLVQVLNDVGDALNRAVP